MAAQPVCPYCGGKLFPHEVTNDQCASCGGRLSGSPDWTSPVREEEPTRAEVRPLRLDQYITLPNQPLPEDFATVRQGVNLVRWAASLAWAFGTLTILFFVGAPILQGPQEFAQTFRALGMFGLTLLFMSGLAVLVGVCLCCSAPRRCGAAKWARCVIPCMVIGSALTALIASDFIIHAGRQGQPGPQWLDVSAGFALLLLLGDGVFGLLCFVLLLAALARYLGEGRLAHGFVNLFLVAVCAVFLAVVGGCMAFAVNVQALSPQERQLTLAVLSGVWLLLVAVLSTWLLILLTRLYHLIPVPAEPHPRCALSIPSR